MNKIYEATPGDINKRIDTVLAEGLEGFTRSAVQKYIEQGLVTVKGVPVTKNYRIHHGDVITCLIPNPRPCEVSPENIPLEVVYEDADLIIINKPQGMVVHPAPGHYAGTMVNALLFHCGKTLSGVNGELRPGIVHRIDKDTSGLLVAAKNDRAHQGLAAQLAAHTMTRIYHAVVWNNIKEEEITIDRPIGRNPDDRKKMAVVTREGIKGRSAVTHVSVLERFGSFTLISARLETGRTHQIRAHMAFTGHPLLGDKVYGPAKQPFGLNGQVLHAKSLGFAHPITGAELFFDSEWPLYFKETVKHLSIHYLKT